MRQGDPLSPILFILAMAKPLESADPRRGFKLGDHTIDTVVYSDDLVLLASSPANLQRKLDGLCKGLQRAGLELNAKKSASISITKDGRSKAMILMQCTFTVEDGNITPMGVLDEQTYLGVKFNWKGRIYPRHSEVLRKWKEELKTAPLKPYQ